MKGRKRGSKGEREGTREERREGGKKRKGQSGEVGSIALELLSILIGGGRRAVCQDCSKCVLIATIWRTVVLYPQSAHAIGETHKEITV